MKSPSEELVQAAADLVAQAQMFQESVLSADEPIQWYLDKLKELRQYLNRAELELSPFGPPRSQKPEFLMEPMLKARLGSVDVAELAKHFENKQ